ncbi:MAG: TetR/AcrR family transcriptional regulator [Pseudomonadota bacterium]
MSRKHRFRAEDWVHLGLSRLSEGGAEAVKLEAICAAAGLTRGSFYYHFEDHPTFLVALAEQWKARQTDDIAAEHAKGGTAEALTAAALTIDYRLELGIRELARRHPAIDETVTAADKVRLDVLSRLYSNRFGLPQEEAHDLAFFEYAAFSGMILLSPDLPKESQQNLAAKYDALMMKALTR